MMYNNGAPGQQHPGAHGGPSLPPFSSIESMGPPRSQPTNVSSMRYNAADNGRQQGRPHEVGSGTKRGLPPPSAANSADSSDAEEEGGELPASGLVAPWEVLRGLADVAIERAAKVCPSESPFALTPHDTQLTLCGVRRRRTAQKVKRRAVPAQRPLSRGRRALRSAGRCTICRRDRRRSPTVMSPVPPFDPSREVLNGGTFSFTVVTKKIISEAEARELFRMCVLPKICRSPHRERAVEKRADTDRTYSRRLDSTTGARRSCPYSTRTWTRTMRCTSGRRLRSTSSAWSLPRSGTAAVSDYGQSSGVGPFLSSGLFVATACRQPQRRLPEVFGGGPGHLLRDPLLTGHAPRSRPGDG